MLSLFAIFQDCQKSLQVSESCVHSYKKMKKKLLKVFGYYPSDYDKIRLDIMEIYIHQPQNLKTPIFNEETYNYIIGFLLQNQRPIKIYIQPLQYIEKKKFIKKVIDEMQFDENGSQISNQQQFAILRPSIPPKYRGQKIVRCAFCKKSNKDKNSLLICGGIYGPFKKNKYAHLLCAIWCNKVYLNQQGQLIGVEQQINIASKYNCIYCKKNGAGLGCHNEKCLSTIHFECGKYEQKCYFNWTKYKFWCHKCKKSQGLQINENSNMDVEQSIMIKLE